MKRPSYVYVASSWRNLMQQAVVGALRAARIECYDFRNPEPGNTGFRWSDIDQDWLKWKTERYREALQDPIAEKGFQFDYQAMLKADCCVLVLPAGRSAHLEAGWFGGRSVPVHTLLIEAQEPDLMYRLFGSFGNISLSLMELLGSLGVED